MVMCGICGKLNFDHQEPVDPKLLEQMMELMEHRGPDGCGYYCNGFVGLGHRRLSIIDLSTGNQPMCNEDRTIWVVYNGEIYNFLELRRQLQSLGHKFKSLSDTEVILHSYEEWGTESIQKFQGMFAFALWDDRAKILLLARDRVGIKPLYYVITPKAIIFASEIKAILADHSVERRINPCAVDRFFTHGYLPGHETLLKDVYKLSPGHYLSVNRGIVKTKQYWDLRFDMSDQWKRFDDAVEQLRVLLRTTVKDHMISDVPVGVLLSGGVDSTGVLRYAVEQTNKPLYTFTIGFEGQDFADERPYARLAARKFNTVHQDITMTAKDFRDFLPKYVWHMEEPVFEPPGVALYYVSRLARESGVKVLLSGEGGDEAFGGYQNYRNLLLLERLKRAFGPAKGLLRLAMQALAQAGWKRIGRYANLVDLPLSEYYLSRTATPYSGFNQLRQDLYSEEFADFLKREKPESPAQALFARVSGQSLLNRMLYVDTKTWLPDDLLLKADKMTMATSVELRVPLLDSQVLEFAAELPETFKVKGWTTKRILKKALEKSVPREIIMRKKTGFPVPYADWLRNEMRDFVLETMGNPVMEPYLSKSGIRSLLERQERSLEFSKEVFCVLIFQLFHETFVRKEVKRYE